MKISGLLAAPFILATLCFAGLLIGCTIYGLYLAFSASIILGFVVLLIEPSPLIIGLVMFVWHKNLAQMIIDYLSN